MTVRPLPGTEGAVHPFFSPDGAWVGFCTPDALKKVGPGRGPAGDVVRGGKPPGRDLGTG